MLENTLKVNTSVGSTGSRNGQKEKLVCNVDVTKASAIIMRVLKLGGGF